MIKICFICHGNICRSPMAEFILKDKVKKLNLEKEFIIVSRATSYEEVGNDIHYGTKEILDKNNIFYDKHFAKRIEKSDYDKYDHFICMDENNLKNTLVIFKEDPQMKVYKLNNEDIKDPWYTGNFYETYNDIDNGIDKLLESLKNIKK